MIVFETRLGDLVEALPKMTFGSVDYKIQYGFGLVEELNKYLQLKKSKTYPLVWLVTDTFDEVDLREPSTKRNANIIIATRVINLDGFNSQQYETQFKHILQPLADKLILLLQSSGVSRLAQTIRVERYPLYNLKDQNLKPIDNWNAISINAEIIFFSNNQCINTNLIK